jgi:hypothetical protein
MPDLLSESTVEASRDAVLNNVKGWVGIGRQDRESAGDERTHHT